MTKEEHIQYWLTTAQHDMESASGMLSSGHYDWALFVGHLALEKILKAHWVKNNEWNVPPRIHDLVKIAELANLLLSNEDKLLLYEVNDFNIEGRYPDFKYVFYKKATKEFAEKYLKRMKEFYECTRKLI